MFTASDQPDLNPSVHVVVEARGSQGDDGPRECCCVVETGRGGWWSPGELPWRGLFVFVMFCLGQPFRVVF